MAKKKPMTDEQIVGLLGKNLRDGVKYTDYKLSSERRKVMEYYQGDKPAAFHEGSSKYVSQDVFDAVDSMRAELVETFSAHSKIVTFTPQTADKVDLCTSASAYCAYVVYSQNKGERLFYDLITNGLTGRVGVMKVFKEEIEYVEDAEFEALTEAEVAVAESRGAKAVDLEEDEDGFLYGRFIATETKEVVRLEVIPPEDFGVQQGATDLEDAKWCWHRVYKSESELIKLYPDHKQEIKKVAKSTDQDPFADEDKVERNFNDQLENQGDSRLQRQADDLTVYEVYADLDVDGDGFTRLWRVVLTGHVLLEKEPAKRKPFACFIPQPRSHRFLGENFAYRVIPTQNARTTLVRSIIDHTLTTNNQRLMVMNGTVPNPDELMDNRLGGLVNVKRIDGIAPIPQNPLNPYVFTTIQLLDEDKEESTGISKLSQGLNKDALSKQNAQGMVEGMVTNSKQRTKVCARQFGEFLKDLYKLIQQVAAEEISQEVQIKASGIDITVDPSEWDDFYNIDVELTLSQDERKAEAMKYMNIDQYLSANPKFNRMYGEKQSYEIMKKAMETQGIMDVDKYLPDPETLPPPQPSESEQLALAKEKQELELAQMEAQLNAAKAEKELAEAKAKVDEAAAKLELEREKFEWQKQVDQWEKEQAEKADEKKAILAVQGN